MKTKALILLSILAIFLMFQNCSGEFQSASGEGSDLSGTPDGTDLLAEILPNFLLSLDSNNASDRFYSVNAVVGGEILLAGQTEGLSAATTKDALIYVYNTVDQTQSYHIIDPSPDSHDQFFHMERSEPGRFLATGISRNPNLTGTAGGAFSNDGLFAEYNAVTKTIDLAMVIGFIVNDVGWEDIIRGSHKIGNDYFVVGVHGAAYPRDNQWMPFIVRLDSTGNVVWAKNINSDFNPRMSAVLGNSLVIFGYHEDATGSRTGGIYRINSNGVQLWHIQNTASGGFWNGSVTARNDILAAGNDSGNGLLVRMDQNGNVLNSTSLQATENDNFFGVKEMANGDIVASAHSRSLGSRDGLDDAALMRLSADLSTVLWAKTYGLTGQHDRIENAHNIAENLKGQIIVSGFSTPDTAEDNTDEAFSFSLNADGSGLETCSQLQPATVTLTDPGYTHTVDRNLVTLPDNLNIMTQMVDINQSTSVVNNASLLQKVCE